MPWSKRNKTTWDYKNGDISGYIVLVKFNNGKTEYQGRAMNDKTRKTGPAVAASTLTVCKNKLQASAKKIR